MKKICALILPADIPINPDASMFDCLTDMVMLKAHEADQAKWE